MKKLLVIPFVAISMFLSATESFLTPARHGVYLGAHFKHNKQRVYDTIGMVKSGDLMPGIEIGYKYDQPQGICFHAGTKFFYKDSTENGKRSQVHLNLDARYRLPYDSFTFSPIVALNSESGTLDSTSNWLYQISTVAVGAEFLTQLNENVKLGLELKGKKALTHDTIYHEHDSYTRHAAGKFYGFEVDLPITFTLTSDRNIEFEVTPHYHFEDFANSKHKIGARANVVHWF